VGRGRAQLESRACLRRFKPVLLAHDAHERPARTAVDSAALGLSQSIEIHCRRCRGVAEVVAAGGASASGANKKLYTWRDTSIFFKFTSLPLPKSSTAAPAAGPASTGAGADAAADSARAAALGGGALDAFEGEGLAAADFEGLGDGGDEIDLEGGAAAAGDLAVGATA
jgi:hypothetical protein